MSHPNGIYVLFILLMVYHKHPLKTMSTLTLGQCLEHYLVESCEFFMYSGHSFLITCEFVNIHSDQKLTLMKYKLLFNLLTAILRELYLRRHHLFRIMRNSMVSPVSFKASAFLLMPMTLSERIPCMMCEKGHKSSSAAVSSRFRTTS